MTGKAADADPLRRPEGRRRRSRRFATGSARGSRSASGWSPRVSTCRGPPCLAWMTSYRTPLFFAQAVGRVVRARVARVGDGVPARRPPAAHPGRGPGGRSATTSCRRRRPSSATSWTSRRCRRRSREAPDGLPSSGRRWRPTPGSRTSCTAARRTPARAAGPALVDAEDEEFLGIPGLFTPADGGAALQAGRRAAAADRGAPDRTTTTTSCSSRTIRTRTTPAARGGTPPSCAGRSTVWSAACRRRRRSRTPSCTPSCGSPCPGRRRRRRRWTSCAPAGSVCAPCSTCPSRRSRCASCPTSTPSSRAAARTSRSSGCRPRSTRSCPKEENAHAGAGARRRSCWR